MSTDQNRGSTDALVHATFDGEPISASLGASIAAALLASGRTGWRTTRDGESRGLFCGIGVCFDCLVAVDGQSGQRACMIPLADGMRVESAVGPRREDHPAPEATSAKADGCCGGGCCSDNATATDTDAEEERA